jgi:hypothetical protein
VNPNVKFKSLPITDDNQKIEVVLDDNQQVSLRLSTWTEGLGWCQQKTMSFDGAMLEDLQRAITAARLKYNRQQSENGQEIPSAKVLSFPIAA